MENTLNLWKKYFLQKIHFILSFLIPILILGAIYAAFGIYPFGDKTILISDMEGQYIDFYHALFDILKNHKSLFYSWQAGMGHNFIPILAYYLSSPFSLLIIFFEKTQLTEALLIMTLLKIGVAGFTFSLNISYLQNRSKVAIVLFAVFYSLMAYTVVYSYNIMWLDGVILLPLVALGVERIIRNNKLALFSVSFIVVIFANFYIAYMVGIFSFLYFLVSFFMIYPFREVKTFFRKFKTYLLSAILSAGTTAFLVLPTYFAIQGGQGIEVGSFTQVAVNFRLFDLFSKLIIGGYDTLKDGLPNIYSGVLTLIMVPLFFLNGKIPKKERGLFLLLTIFLVISFYFSNLNLMWHAFDHPNWFPYRYSFVFSFILVTIAYRAWIYLERVETSKLVIVTGFWVFLVVLILYSQYPYLSERLLMVNIIFFAIYAGLIYLYTYTKQQKQNLILVVLTIVVIFESSLSSWNLITSLDNEFKYQKKSNYTSTLDRLSGLTNQIKVMDDSFYRMERTRGLERSLNDSMSLHYQGISFFNSMINLNLVKFLHAFGFITPVYMAVNYAGATHVTDSFLSVKYVLSEREQGFGYHSVLQQDKIQAYENTYALPLGFLVHHDLLNLQTERNNPFVIQNELLNRAVHGKNQHIEFFKEISIIEETFSNAAVSSQDGKLIYKKKDESKPGYVEFTLDNKEDQEVYMYLPQDGYSYVDVYINKKFKENYLHFYNNKVIDLGYHEKGQKVNIRLVMNENSFTLTDKHIYGLDSHAFDIAIEKLKEGVLDGLKVTDTTVTGRVHSSNKFSLLFTSIPYDPGWSAFVDGVEVPIASIGGAFIGIELLQGEHEILFKFIPKGFKHGVAISILSIIMLSVYIKKQRSE